MPFNPTTSSEDCVINKLAEYFILYQQCSDLIQPYGTQGKIIYDEAYEEWRNNPSSLLIEPPQGDQEETTEYFRTCDLLCATKPKNVHE